MTKSNALWLMSALWMGSAAAAPPWEYSGEAGPEHWAQLTPEFAACAGKNQTPINVQGFIAAQLKPIKFEYIDGGEEILNNGHTIQVKYAPSSSITLDGVA